MVIYITKPYKLVIKHTDRETERERGGRGREREREREKGRQGERERDRERKADREREREREKKEKERKKGRQTDRHKESERQTGREREREIYTDRNKDKDKQGPYIIGFGVQSINSFEYTIVSLTTILILVLRSRRLTTCYCSMFSSSMLCHDEKPYVIHPANKTLGDQ